MYMVYWTEMVAGEDDEQRTRVPQSRLFTSCELNAAMKFMEALRTRQRAGEGVCFITLCSEHPESVGHPGVADPDANYSWKKRRR